MNQNGKGDKRRPKSVDQKTWDKNWDRIFKPKPKDKHNVKRDQGSN